MKLFALLITFLVGFAAASSEFGWQSQKEYRFAYSGRMLTGIPELSNQYSGLGINATVSLKVKDSKTLILSLENAKFVAVNQELESQEGSRTYDEGNNWRRVRLPEMTRVNEKYASILKEPLVFRLGEDGGVQKVIVSENEPVWSSNFKKSLVTLFQSKMQTSSIGQSENMIDSPLSERRPYYTVKEQTIIGECEATYQVNELPEYIIRDQPSLVSNPEACQGQKYYEVLRTINFEKCDRLASFQYFANAQFSGCSTDNLNNCGNFWGRSSSVRYIACGARESGKLSVQTIINDGEMNSMLVGHNTERIITGTSQNLTLVKVTPCSNFPEPRNPKTLTSLLYDFLPISEQQQQQHSLEGNDLSEQLSTLEGSVPRRSQNPKTISQSHPSNFLSGLSGTQQQQVSKNVGDRVVHMLREVAQQIHGVSGSRLSEAQIGMKLLTATRGFVMIKTSGEIEDLYQQINQQGSNDEIRNSTRQLFLDSCAMSGTPQAIEFFDTVIRSGDIGQKEITHFFLWLSHNVITPTETVLNRLFKMIMTRRVINVPSTYSVAITGFSQLVQQACVSPHREVQYPTEVYGEFCNPESSIVQQVLIPYLSKESRKTEVSENHRNVHIVALGLLTHKNIVGELTPLIEKSEGQQSSIRRVLALYSLSNVGRSNPNLVTPLLQTLFTNPSESTEVRIIAFNSLLRLNPSTQIIHTIATITRQEPSMDFELLKTINIAFYTLGHSELVPTMPVEQIELRQKCREAYMLVKKTYGIAPSSGSYYKTEFLKDFGVGYQGYFHWISSQESIIPKSVFMKLDIFMQSVNLNVFEIGYRLRGVESLFEKVSDSLNGQSGSLSEQIRQGLSSEWKNVIEKLQLKTRESSKLDGTLFLRGMASGVFLNTFTESTSEHIRQKIVEVIKNPSLSSINGETSINMQKSFVVSPCMMVVPSDMGFPINVEVNTPVVTSFTGRINVNSEKSNPSVSVEGKLIYTSQLTGWVGTVVPFTQEYVLTGIDQHMLYNVPGTLRVSVNVPEQKVSVSVKPGTGSRSGETDVWHYHVMPYTVKEKIDSLVPHTKSSGMKLIKSNTPKKTGVYNFGENLGLSLKANYQTESRFTDFRSIVETIRMYKYSPLNMALFQYTTPAFTGKMRPSARMQKYTVTINPTESSTKEIQMEFQIGCATKLEGNNTKYHSVKTVSESERLSGQEQRESVEGSSPSIASLVKKVLPYRVHSESLESTSKHQSRVEKLQHVMQGLGETESSTGFTVITRVVLKGNRPRTFTYTLSAAGGKNTKESKRTVQKWNVHLESSHQSQESRFPKKICINGKLDFPLLPMWNINDLRTTLNEFYYQNKISFGQQECTESEIITKGVSRVSHKQQQHSQETPEAKQCQKLVQEQVQGSELSQVCQQAREQASSLDEIEFTTEHKRVPQGVKEAERKVVSILKAYLWPYYNFKASSVQGSQSLSSQESYQTKTRIAFKQNTPSFDLTIIRPTETIIFDNVHIAEPYSIFFPLKATQSQLSTVRKVTGSSIFPSCKVDAKTVTSFDNKTISFNPDKCFHLLTADCSKYNRFGVTVRKVEGGNKEVKVYLKNTVVKMTPSGSSSTGPKITVNGEPIEIRVNQESKITAQGTNGKTLATITKTIDGVVVLKAPSLYLSELAFNGKLISVVPSPMLKNKLCGLCGDNNQEQSGDISGPKKCVFSKPELQVASYRIPSESCPPMSGPIRQELRKETEQCSKFQVQPSKVAQGYKVNTGKCTILRHLTMQKQGQICISKVPVTQCGPSCKTTPSQLVEKTVPFVCLPQGRLADHYVRKIQQGKPVEELKSMETSFETKMEQPRHCVHALVSGSTPSY